MKQGRQPRDGVRSNAMYGAFSYLKFESMTTVSCSQVKVIPQRQSRPPFYAARIGNVDDVPLMQASPLQRHACRPCQFYVVS